MGEFHIKPLEVRTLTDGGQSALSVAEVVGRFLAVAERTLDLALYDVRLDGPEARPVAAALLEARARGVEVRVAYNADHPGPIPVPPPPVTIPDLLEALPLPTRAIPGIPDLMHHKYAVRDGEAVLTGSANWTEDSWSRQENVLCALRSVEIAAAYVRDFEQIWRSGVAESGDVEPKPVEVAGTVVRAWFTPGRGTSLTHEIARRIDRARTRVRVASPVVTSGPILGTLAQVATDRRVDLAGLVDAVQVEDVIRQWRASGNASWKIPLLEAIVGHSGFTGKRSTPWGTGTVHDFMHAKVTVCDDVVFLGSFNLSRSGETNAENVLEIREAALADRLAAYVDEIRALYPPLAVST